LSATRAAPSDIVRFLLDHPPFDALGADRVRSVADAVEIEEHPAGTTIISQGADPVQHLRVVRTGTIEIVDGSVYLIAADVTNTGTGTIHLDPH
jgi:CBS domain-containing protein